MVIFYVLERLDCNEIFHFFLLQVLDLSRSFGLICVESSNDTFHAKYMSDTVRSPSHLSISLLFP